MIIDDCKKVDISREKLIQICEKAFVKQENWGNRDSYSSQIQLGECYALLKAGCDFEVKTDECSTLWVTIKAKGFDYWDRYPDGQMTEGVYYLPTEDRLKKCGSEDWY